MPDIKCKHIGCPNYISDPCIKVAALFQIKSDLSSQLDNNINSVSQKKNINEKIHYINALLEEDIGLQEHEKHYENFVTILKTNIPNSETKLFTLECISQNIENSTILTAIKFNNGNRRH